MSVKHVKEYFDQVANQYSEMLNELRDFEKEAQEGLIEPERLDKIKENMQPLINNYQTLSWIMFLLNQPNKKEKVKKYERQNKTLLNTLKKEFSREGVINTNEEVLSRLKHEIKGE